jgi:hypothetical protein
MKLWPFIKAAPERRRVSTKLDAAYEARRIRELRAARERFEVAR